MQTGTARTLSGWRVLALAISLAGFLIPITDALTAEKPKSVLGGGDKGGFAPKPIEEEDNAYHPKLFPRSNYVWPFGTGPLYGEEMVDAPRWSAPGMLHTQVGSFDMTRGLPPFPAELRTGVKLDKLGAQYFILQIHPDAFADGSFDRIRDSITGTGGAIVQEMAVAAFITRLTAAGHSSLQGMPGLIALEPYHPALKLSPTIGRAPHLDPLKALSDIYTLELQLFPGEDVQAVAQALAGLGAGATKILGSDLVVADVHRTKLAEVAALEPVYMVFEHLPVTVHAEETTTTTQSGRWNLGATPYIDAGLRGDGNGLAGTSTQILMVLDTGAQLDGGDLSDQKSNAGVAGNDPSNLFDPSHNHRKVKLYTTTNAYAGSGDMLGCDSSGSGSFTHGHMVSSTALGNASITPSSYGGSFFATDTTGKQWKVDGVAPRAKVLIYDAQVTPASGLGCETPVGGGDLLPGDLYDRVNQGTCPACGSMQDAYNNGARVYNFSFGNLTFNAYGARSTDVDQFLFDHKDAMSFVSVGNSGRDTSPADGFSDNSRAGDPATCKSCVPVGAVGNANDTAAGASNAGQGQDDCAVFSSAGPATSGSGRVIPILMAPGQERGNMGIASEFSCRSSDNDQANPVECDIIAGLSGTSFSSPAAAGAALVVRDYFQQGYYPDGTSTNPGNSTDQEPNISGALVKAILIASAEWVGQGSSPGNPWNPGVNCGHRYRFNNKTGYGRIQLNRVLPLQTYASPSGLIVTDGGGVAGAPNNLGLSGTANPNITETTTIRVCDNSQDLSVALAWIEDSGAALTKNLNLELVSPSNKVYFGNYYTDDNSKDRLIDLATEDCDYTEPLGDEWPPASTDELNSFPWSLPTCANSARDTQNPTEAIHLSADPRANGVFDDAGTSTIHEGRDNQIEIGTWTLKVIGGSFTGSQGYAVAVAGPVCLGSSARINIKKRDDSLSSGNAVCTDRAQFVVAEVDEGTDTGLNNNPTEIASRTTVQVVDKGADGAFDTGDDVVVDTETALTFADTDGAGSGLQFESNLLVLTDSTSPDSGNGALDIRSGQRLRVTYQDETSGSPDLNKKRVANRLVDCAAKISLGGVVWGQFGRDAFTLINGGCERDARGLFTFGFPDRYMDAGETLDYRIAFLQSDSETLEDVQVSLRCVLTDSDSPKTCIPDSGGCADPNRTNNAACSQLTVLDSPKVIGDVPSNGAVSANFTVRPATSITGTPEIEMILGVKASKSGRTVEGLAVSRHFLDADETSFFYATDFPTGGTETRDFNGNETIENPSTSYGEYFTEDYKFETRTYSDLTATGFNNAASLEIPWNFDSTTKGGYHGSSTVFRSGLAQLTDRTVLANLAQFGEDMNYNSVLDSGEDRDPVNLQLDQNWSTQGGCGWQTRGAITTGGVWHTGRIDTTALPTCTASGAASARCQLTETIPGVFGANQWWELLLTPVISKVNKCPPSGPASCLGREDQPGQAVFGVEIQEFEWNALLDLPDRFSLVTWEFDTNAAAVEPIDLVNDGAILNLLIGPHGAISGGNVALTGGAPLFAALALCVDTDQDGVGDHCGFAGGPACSDLNPCTGAGQSVNGSVVPNRQGDNNCFFETPASIPGPYGLAGPADDDVRNGWCRHLSCSNDRARYCVDNTDCVSPGVCDAAAPPTAGSSADVRNRDCTTANASASCGFFGYAATCDFDSGTTVDQFVTANGPIRNINLFTANGPQLPFQVLEDIYGDSGESFQGAIGFFTTEGTTSSQAVPAFGLALDDLNVAWREFRLDKDVTDCSTSGSCAAVDVQSTNFYEGNALLTVTVADLSPWEPASTGRDKNDCNRDGDYTDAGIDDQDCDNNGTVDIAGEVTSDEEQAGEPVILNRTSDPSGTEYKGTIPISSSYDMPGTLFIVRDGALNFPGITARYDDRWDGTSTGGVPNKCRSGSPILGSALPPNEGGLVTAGTPVIAPAAKISLAAVRLTDNGDNDGFADTNETVSVFPTFINRSGFDLDDATVTLINRSPSTIESICTPAVSMGPMNKDQAKETPTPLVFKVRSDVARTALTINDPISATFLVTFRSDQFDTIERATRFTLDLDFNVSGTCTATTFSEGFESGTFGQFTSMSLDGVGTEDGHRCQYNDPEAVNGNGPCPVPPGGGPAVNGYDWHVHTTTHSDGGRAYGGSNSLHWGTHPLSGAKNDGSRFAQLDAIRTTNPINLGIGSATELKFKHQISMVDNRLTNTLDGQSAFRSMTAVQITNAAGDPIGVWLKVFPYENAYDAQGADNFFNCTYEPTDDGNNEDSYFDPDDPLRRYGPSSTCNPEFSFSCHGDTEYKNVFVDSKSNLCRADGPGFKGAIDRGTWVEPRFDLGRFKGRRLRVRFLSTSLEVAAVATTDVFVAGRDTPFDDGWYIDDVQLTGACTTPLSVSADEINNSGLPACVGCSNITAALSADPAALSAPGQVTELSAAGSIVNSCLNGVLQFRFFIDRNGNGNFDSGTDTLLRDWTDDPIFVDAPTLSTTYSVGVRCGSNTACDQPSVASSTVTVDCPSTDTQFDPAFAQTIKVDKPALTGAEPDVNASVNWATSATVDGIRGDLDLLKSNGGNFTPTVLACIGNNVTVTSITDNTNPGAAGQGLYYLIRGSGQFCNKPGTWSTGNPREAAGRNGEIIASANSCP